MLHVLVGEWDKGEESRKRHDSLELADGRKPPEPNTRATSPAPEGSHTTTQVDTHNTRHYGGNTKKQRALTY